jgi:Uma2 family endonuclease
MGNSHLQFEACRVLIALLIDYLRRRHGERVYRVGSELHFHLDPDDLNQKVVPDLYVMEDEPQAGPKVPSWKKWEHDGKVPSLAVEVVSDSYKKDYSPEEMPRKYTELGIKELVRYDPDHADHRRTKYERRLFGHFVRDEQGTLVEQPVEGDRVKLHSYPIWLVHTEPYHLRILTGPSKAELVPWPTADERERATDERARRETERAASEAERAASEAERATRAEAEVRRLQAELLRLRGEVPTSSRE